VQNAFALTWVIYDDFGEEHGAVEPCWHGPAAIAGEEDDVEYGLVLHEAASDAFALVLRGAVVHVHQQRHCLLSQRPHLLAPQHRPQTAHYRLREPLLELPIEGQKRLPQPDDGGQPLGLGLACEFAGAGVEEGLLMGAGISQKGVILALAHLFQQLVAPLLEVAVELHAADVLPERQVALQTVSDLHSLQNYIGK
jgi:hypothetical protein